MRELSIFIDESGDFGPFEKHSPSYVLSLVFHDQGDDITGHLDKIHAGLRTRGLSADHAVHAGPLVRREQEYRWMGAAGAPRCLPSARRLPVPVRALTHHSWVFRKRELDYDQLVSRMSRELGALMREHVAYFAGWDRIVIYDDNGQKEITTRVNSVFNALLSNVAVRKVVPSDYSLFQVADLCCTLARVRQKIETVGLSSSASDFFSTPKDGAARALKKGYFKTLDRKRFGSSSPGRNSWSTSTHASPAVRRTRRTRSSRSPRAARRRRGARARRSRGHPLR
ncbi:hypothetical protein GCM10022237_23910 [Nocardioides ginsengisoli]|uniref:DUF3800 domain-containing protein n=1 Tax=Nocardioides ginsengisoli TaxID=363868 RepID=A0ABW3W544_9ACTN